MKNIYDFWGSKKGVAQYAESMKANLNPGSVWTMITSPAMLGGFYVSFVTDESSDVIEKIMDRMCSCSPRTTTSTGIIPVI